MLSLLGCRFNNGLATRRHLDVEHLELLPVPDLFEFLYPSLRQLASLQEVLTSLQLFVKGLCPVCA